MLSCIHKLNCMVMIISGIYISSPRWHIHINREVSVHRNPADNWRYEVFKGSRVLPVAVFNHHSFYNTDIVGYAFLCIK